jgi:hypothetical protein
MILWYLHRQPIRTRLLDRFREKTVKKYSKRIAAFIENIAMPLARLKIRDEVLGRLASVKSQQEHEELVISIEKEIEDLKNNKSGTPKFKDEDEATMYVVEGFIAQMSIASKADFNKAFKSPLEESNAKMKYVFDRMSFRVRRHIFVIASVFYLLSIFLEVLIR